MDSLDIRSELSIDSIKQMEIVATVEYKYGISLNEDKLLALVTLGDFYELIIREINTQQDKVSG